TIGGFAGRVGTSTVTNSYSAGAMTVYSAAAEDVGGLVGYSQGTGTVTSSYWDTDVSGQVTSAEGSGLGTAAMKTEGSFSGWDFSTIWNIDGSINDGYP
ncbi:peptidase A26, partial [Candidatus Dojkabacteria bacterium CG_4_10_14_3_um_filter_Dojkabacteria_WS6_41_9]